MNNQPMFSSRMSACQEESRIFLPHINMFFKTHKRINPRSKAKKPRKVHWYTDQFLDMGSEPIREIVALMDERERFKGLREFTKKVVKTKNSEYRTRFVINAQTQQDCHLATLYINYHLKKARYHGSAFIDDIDGLDDIFDECTNFDYSKIFHYHTDWRDGSGENSDFDIGKDGILVKAEEKENDDSAEKPDPESGPIWRHNTYPMFIESGTSAYSRIANDKNFTDKFDLVYALEYRDGINANVNFEHGGFGDLGFLDFNNKPAERNADEALTLAGFKTIYIPDADSDELKKLFEHIAKRMGLRLDKNLQFSTLKKEYQNFLKTESDIVSIATIIREKKIFEQYLSSPVTYKDFSDALDSSSARKEYAASKSGKKKENPWDELNKLIGNEKIKEDIRCMVDALILDKRRREFGLPAAALTKHSLFFGSPGTSKTTVSRIIAKILKHEGIIRGDSFRECVKSDIVGQYVGWTASAVDSIFKELADAGGGVLFLDEAYTYSQDPTVFDKEAINCIVQGMENHREIMCIFAGYKEPMKQFVEANPGLRSRIGFVFEFGDYSSDAMLEIAKYQADELGFKLPDNCEELLVEYFTELKRLQGDGWGNGREARKVLEQASLQLAGRLARQKKRVTKSDCRKLKVEDLKNAIHKSLERERAFNKDKRNKIGFAGRQSAKVG